MIWSGNWLEIKRDQMVIKRRKKVYTEASYGDHLVWKVRARPGQELDEKHQELEDLLHRCRPQSVRT